MFKRIIKGKINFRSHFTENSKDLIVNLLKKDPSERLGFNSIEDIKSHSFFENIDWDELYALKTKAPIIP